MYGTPRQTYAVLNNVFYLADGSGLITNVAQIDVQTLVDQGCIGEAAWLKLQTAHPIGGPTGATGAMGPTGPAAPSGSGAVTAVAGAATLNTPSGIVTSEPLTSANSYTLTLTNNVIKSTSTVLVSGYDGTNIWAPTAIAITTGAAAISLHSLSSPSNSTISIAFAVFN
jgi:hypothetical protein